MRRLIALVGFTLLGCGDPREQSTSAATVGNETGGDGDGDGDPGDGDGDPGDGDGDGDSTIFDMALAPDFHQDPPVDPCKVIDDMNAIGDCDETAPPDAFEPDLQWDWWGPDGKTQSFVPALVANLTDDNDDGAIDLCDTPDIVVVAVDYPYDSFIFVLDGATGALHFHIPTFVAFTITPAIGDIDNDGLPEIVAGNGPGFMGPSRIIAFEHDGTHKWTSDATWEHGQGGSIALADLDNDGDVEVLADRLVLDHEGNTVFVAPAQQGLFALNTAVTAADLDGDADLEVVLGQSAYHHDGTQVYFQGDVMPGFPQIANLDGDPNPEIVVTNNLGVTLLEHDGTPVYIDAHPDGIWTALRPAAIHDFDGDGEAEYAVSSMDFYSVFEPSPAVVWSAVIDDSSGWSGGTRVRLRRRRPGRGDVRRSTADVRVRR